MGATDSWPAPPPDYPSTGADATRAHPSRRPSTATLLVCLLATAGAATLAIGIVRIGPRARDHQAAVDRLSAVQQQNARLHDRVSSEIAAVQQLRTELSSQRARIAYLLQARASGFASAISAGSQSGATVGTAAGARAGIRDAHAQRRSADSAGWYYVRVSWRSGLPMIADSYTLDPGAEHAYWVEGGKAVNRDTSSP